MDRTPAAPSRGELSGSDLGGNLGRDGEEQLRSTDATASVIAIPIEGGKWDAELYDVITPTCPTDLITKPYHSKHRTGFVSFPRSGNSYLRGLVERATGFQTSSVYCDRGLARTFVGECNIELNFFVKVSSSLDTSFASRRVVTDELCICSRRTIQFFPERSSPRKKLCSRIIGSNLIN